MPPVARGRYDLHGNDHGMRTLIALWPVRNSTSSYLLCVSNRQEDTQVFTNIGVHKIETTKLVVTHNNNGRNNGVRRGINIVGYVASDNTNNNNIINASADMRNG